MRTPKRTAAAQALMPFKWEPAEQMKDAVSAEIGEVTLLALPSGLFEVREAGRIRVEGRHGDSLATAKVAAEGHARSILTRRAMRK